MSHLLMDKLKRAANSEPGDSPNTMELIDNKAHLQASLNISAGDSPDIIIVFKEREVL